MARLAGSPVPVPTTLRSTAGSMALKPGPSRVLWTSTTLTSAAMATLRRVCAATGAARARAAATAMIWTSMSGLLSGMIGSREDSEPPRGNLDLDGAGLGGSRAVHQHDGIAHPHIVTIVRAQEEALLEKALESGDREEVGHGIEGEIGRAHDHEHGPAERPRIRQRLIAHPHHASFREGLEPVRHPEEIRGEGARRLEIDLLGRALLHARARIH